MLTIASAAAFRIASAIDGARDRCRFEKTEPGRAADMGGRYCKGVDRPRKTDNRAQDQWLADPAGLASECGGLQTVVGWSKADHPGWAHMISGRRGLNEYDQLGQDWRHAADEQVRREYTEALAAG